MTTVCQWLIKTLCLSGVLLMVACSPSERSASTDEPIDYPLPFAWQAPARLNVIETLVIDGRTIKVRYDINVAAHDTFANHVVLSFANASPIEIDNQQVNLSSYPTDIRNKTRLILSDYYSRPSLIVNPAGEVVQVIDIEKSVRALVDLSYPDDVPAQLKAYQAAVRNSALLAKVETSAYNVHGCLIRPWVNFATPENQSTESPIDMVLVDGGRPVPALRTLTNYGRVAGESSQLHLKSDTQAGGTELADMMLDLTFQLEGRSEARPSLEGVATASRSRVSEVKLDARTLQPVWARCDTHFLIESSDDDLLRSTDNRRSAEYRIEWLDI